MRARCNFAPFAKVYGETRACYLHTEVEVDQTVLLARSQCGSASAEEGHMASGGFHHIVGGSLSFGQRPAGNIGYIEKFGVIASSVRASSSAIAFCSSFEHGHGSLGCLCVLAAAFLHGAAYAVGHTLELGGGIIVLSCRPRRISSRASTRLTGFSPSKPFTARRSHDKSRVGLYLL